MGSLEIALNELRRVFPVVPVPLPEEAANLVHLREGELGNVLGRPWPELLADGVRTFEEGDCFLLKPVGIAYYAPAFLACAMIDSEDEIAYNVAHAFVRILPKILAQDLLTEEQREVVGNILADFTDSLRDAPDPSKKSVVPDVELDALDATIASLRRS